MDEMEGSFGKVVNRRQHYIAESPGGMTVFYVSNEQNKA